LSYYSPDLRQEFGFASFYFSLVVMAAGLIVCFLTSWFASYFTMIKGQVEVYSIIKNQYLISTILMTPVLFLVYLYCLPYYFAVNGKRRNRKLKMNIKLGTVVSKYDAFACSCIGLWGGYIIGWYFHHQSSAKGNYIKNMAQFCEYNSGYNILMGVAHGNMSTIIPNLILGGIIIFYLLNHFII
jgi:Na+/H+-translocating membrane pyrophosphatase